MKDVGSFLGDEKNRDFFWVLQFSSAQINNNIIAIYCKLVWDFFGYAKKRRDFFGYTNSKVGIFLGIKYEPLSPPPPPPPPRHHLNI